MEGRQIKEVFLIANVIIGLLIYAFLILGSIFPSLRYISIREITSSHIFKAYFFLLGPSIFMYIYANIRCTRGIKEINLFIRKLFSYTNISVLILVLFLHVLQFMLEPEFLDNRLFRVYLILLVISIIMHIPDIMPAITDKYKLFKISVFLVSMPIVTYFTYLILNPEVYETFIGFVEFIIIAIFVFCGIERHSEQILTWLE